MSHQTLIRLSRARSCVAHWESVGSDIRLIRVSPDQGPVPDTAYIAGAVFPDIAAMRRAVLAAMRGPVGTTLDRVLLTRSAYDRWIETAKSAAVNVADPSIIPDEQARPLSGGRLLIWVDIPGGQTVKLILEKGEWAWRDDAEQNH